MTFLDDYSRYVVAQYISHKFNVVDNFIENKSMMDNQLSTNIECVHTDDRGEYINKRLS